MSRPRTSRHPDRPFVLLNMAMTADGKIATANRAVESFGSPRDQAHLYEIRAGVDAVLCGARTAGADGVTLGSGGARYDRMRTRLGVRPELLRVIASGSARVSPESGVFSGPGGPTLVLACASAPLARRRRLEAVADAVGVFGSTEVDLAAALQWLRREWDVRRLVCEGGGELNDAMFRAGLVDEVHLTVCPLVFGGRTAPTLAEGAGVPRLGLAARLRIVRHRQWGGELFLVCRVEPGGSAGRS